MPHDLAPLALALITFVAAFVNGALGYGFSAITLPVALVFYSNRALNPALVLVELLASLHVLYLSRSGIARVRRKALAISVGLVPAALAGGYLLRSVNAEYVKLGTYGVLLPLVLLQALGFRRPIRAEGPVGVAFGSGLGLLYSLTTISGAPLAFVLKNEGLAKAEFKAALSLIRVPLGIATAAAYGEFGLITGDSAGLARWILPSLLIGLPLGARAVEKVDVERFRRVCVSFDIWIIAFGLMRVLKGMGLPGAPLGGLFAGVVGIDAWLYVRERARGLRASASP